MSIDMREKSCLICGTSFTPMNTAQRVCTAQCAIQYAVAKREKKRAKEERIAARASKKIIRLRKEKLKTIMDWTKDAQTAFNAYIRERDKHRPCICCGAPLTTEAVGGGFDCGHYRSVGSAPHLRFDERNAHGQTKRCNRYGAGRAVDYRIGLIRRIGLAEVESLESDQSPKKYSIDDLKTITATYRQKLRDMKNDI